MFDDLNSAPSRVLEVARNRREFLGAGLASLAVIASCAPTTPTGFGVTTIYTRDLPPLNLHGWRVAIRELTFPPGLTSPKHTHPGFVFGYVLDGAFRFHLDGHPVTVLTAGQAFSEAPGDIHLPSGSASATKPARVLVFSVNEKGKEATTLL